MATNMQTIIMRRIYIVYVYTRVWAVVRQRAFWYGGVAALALVLFAEYVHVRSVLNNILATPVGDVPLYVTQTITGALSAGEFVTVVSLLVLCAMSLWALRVLLQLFSLTTLSRIPNFK